MPRTADPTDIPQRLASAGLQLFLQQGYNATGIQQIADRAGVPKGSFYNHFESKDAFAALVVSRYAEWMRRSWTRMMSTAPAEPMAAIRHVFAQMVAYHERAPHPVGCLVGNFAAEIASSSPACRKSLMEAQFAWLDRLTSMIVAGQQSGAIRDDLDANTLSALTWSAWEGALLRMKVEGSTRPLHESAEVMLDTIYAPFVGTSRVTNLRSRTEAPRASTARRGTRRL
jgi:TetR/AcrR family transcriptional repressor of nem operon